MNQRACLYLTDHSDLIQKIRDFSEFLFESSERHRLYVYFATDNPQFEAAMKGVTAPTLSGYAIKMHSVLIPFLIEQNFREENRPIGAPLIVAKPETCWHDDVDVWINLPVSYQLKLVALSAQPYFLNLRGEVV